MNKKSSKDPFYERESAKYKNPIPSREYIMSFMKTQGRPVTQKTLLTHFNLEGVDECEALRRRLRAMVRDGQVLNNRRRYYMLVKEAELVSGVVQGHRDGYGFLLPDEAGSDVFLTSYQMRQVFSGDKVLVRVTGVDRRGRREGVIAKVIKHHTQRVVGRYWVEGGCAFVEPDDKSMSQDILIPDDQTGHAQSGCFVSVEITAQPTLRRQASGRVIEVLGDSHTPGIETEVVMRAFGLPHKWPNAVKAEAEQWASFEIPKEEYARRKDIRHLPLVTIDGSDAKDFDDAVYCTPLKSGGWRLYVAIADVSYFVQPDSALDREAYIRGNSVYFPSQVVPMLPTVLSNEWCSLNPHVDRLCMVCEMEVSQKGQLQSYQFYDAVMQSSARLTYEEVGQFFKTKLWRQHKALHPHLNALHDLFIVLFNRRKARGALEFDTTETKIVFSEDRKIKKIVPRKRNDAHRMIEECMLLANVATARQLTAQKIAFLYRVHEPPSSDKLEALRETLKELKLSLSGGQTPKPSDYARLLEKASDRVDAKFIQTIVLRSLSQAVYSPDNQGHFGLAYDAYCHFTSPIRRYPDLLIHRALRATVLKQKAHYAYPKSSMEKLGKHCSSTERRADEATREAVDWLKCEYMLDKVGNCYSGYVTGVTDFGLFVELTNIYVEGLLHVTALSNDYYHFDATQHTLTARHSGQVYRLGDQIKVSVARVDISSRQIDFELVSE